MIIYMYHIKKKKNESNLLVKMCFAFTLEVIRKKKQRQRSKKQNPNKLS